MTRVEVGPYENIGSPMWLIPFCIYQDSIARSWRSTCRRSQKLMEDVDILVYAPIHAIMPLTRHTFFRADIFILPAGRCFSARIVYQHCTKLTYLASIWGFKRQCINEPWCPNRILKFLTFLQSSGHSHPVDFSGGFITLPGAARDICQRLVTMSTSRGVYINYSLAL